MDDSELWLYLVMIAIFLIFSAFFSSAETAFFSLSKLQRRRLEQAKTESEKKIPELLSKPRQILITILLGNTVVNVAASCIAAMLAVIISEKFLHNISVAVGIEIVVMTIILLIFGEITPKNFAIRFSETYAAKSSYALSFFRILFYPIVKILEWITMLFTTKKSHYVEENKITSEDIKNVVSTDSYDTILKTQEREIIDSIFDFSDKLVKEIMIPRIDIIAVSIEQGIEKIREAVVQSGHSRIPIYKEDIDDILGIIYAKDIILSQEKNLTIQSLMRECYFVPENTKIKLLLKEFQKSKMHLAIVVNEYGGTSGIVTLEDILEELVGEILDEYDKEQIMVKRLDKNEYLVNSSIDLDDLNDKFNLQIDEDKYDTFSGFLYDLFGKIPEVNESRKLRNKFLFTINSIEGQRINSVKLTILDEDDKKNSL